MSSAEVAPSKNVEDVNVVSTVPSPAENEVKKSDLFLRFDASLKAPNYMSVFMENGGKIDAMAARWQSDFAISGSETSTPVTFVDKRTIPISLKMPEQNYEFVGNGRVQIPTDMRLNGMTQRMCAAINGTLVHSLSGESSDFLYHVFQGGSHFQMGMTYKTFLAHASTLAVSNARLVSVDENGEEIRYKPMFKKMSDDKKKVLGAADQITEQYVKAAYATRQQVVYHASPMLTKSVFADIVGINGRGYSLLHSIMDREAYVSLETLNSLYEAAVACDCCQDKNDIQSFLSSTNNPGLQAALEARTVASATSLIVNVLMSYRADGRNIVAPTGAAFTPVENWNHSVPRSALESNDCDGLALLAVSLIRSTLKLTPEQLEDPKYNYLRAVRNVVFPHYQLAISVIGASAAEATSADGDHKSIAGHAITVLIPTMSFLRALSKTTNKQIGKDGPLMFAEGAQDTVNSTRFLALFPKKTVEQLPGNEKGLLTSWNTAKHEFTQLQAFAIEGTTPASPVMFTSNPERRIEASKNADLDKKVFAMSAPNVFRSIKVLHVGGSSNGSTHVFYSDLVEVTFAPDNPLYKSNELRAINAAATQYVLTTDIDGDEITSAGCTPRQMVMEEYGAFPLIRIGKDVAEVLDTAATVAKMDVMPPREKKSLQLSEYQSKRLAESMKHIQELEDMLDSKRSSTEVKDNHHCVAYICAFNTLVHNPAGVKQFVETVKRVAVSGVVDKRVIPGLARDTEGNEVGMFLHLDIYCPV